MSQVADIAAAIREHHFNFADEDMLQEGLAAALQASGFEVEREVRINRGRLDMLVNGRYGVEAKITCPIRDIARQVARYLDGDDLDGIVVVSVTPRHHGLPGEINGKPVEVVALASGAL